MRAENWDSMNDRLYESRMSLMQSRIITHSVRAVEHITYNKGKHNRRSNIDLPVTENLELIS